MKFSSKYSVLWKNLNKMEACLDNYLLYVDFIDNPYELPIILLKDNSVLILFELKGLNYEGLSEIEKETIKRSLKNTIELLDHGFSFSNFLIREKAEVIELDTNENSTELIRQMQEHKQEFWHGLSQKSYANKIFCCLKYTGLIKQKLSWKLLINERKAFIFYQNKILRKVEKLFQGYVTLKKSLEEFGFRELSKEESFSILYRFVNQDDPPKYRKDITLNSQLSHSYLEFKKDYLKLNNEFVAVIAIKYPPDETFPILFERFYHLNFFFCLVQNFTVVNYNKLEKGLLMNKNIALSLSHIDKMSQDYVADLSEFQDAVISNKNTVLSWSFNIYVSGKSLEDLKNNILTVKTIIKELGSFGFEEKYNLSNALFSTFPGHEMLSQRNSIILSSNAADIISAYSLYQGDDHPVDYFIDRQNSIFSFAPFSFRQNAHHMLITGPTGSGKSFFANKMCFSCMVQDPILYVIDLTQSFSEFFGILQEDLGADTAVFELSNQKIDFKLNPFLIENLDLGPSEEQIKYCEGLIRLMVGEKQVTEPNRVLIRKALELFFREYQMILQHQPQKAPEPIDMLVQIITQLSRNRDLAASLEYWTQGDRGTIFNTGSDCLKTARYCYFNLQNMETHKDEKIAIIYSIFSKIIREIRNEENRKIPKMLILDEAHHYLKIPEMSYWIDLLIRTGRHYNLMITLITQSINDIISEGDWSKGVITNLKQAVIFPGQNDVEAAFSQFQMNEKQVEMYNGLIPERREFLYWSSEGHRRILANLTDPYTYWMATTDPVEKSFRQKVKSEICNGNSRKSIEKCMQITDGCTSLEERHKKIQAFSREMQFVNQSISKESESYV